MDATEPAVRAEICMSCRGSDVPREAIEFVTCRLHEVLCTHEEPGEIQLQYAGDFAPLKTIGAAAARWPHVIFQILFQHGDMVGHIAACGAAQCGMCDAWHVDPDDPPFGEDAEFPTVEDVLNRKR